MARTRTRAWLLTGVAITLAVAALTVLTSRGTPSARAGAVPAANTQAAFQHPGVLVGRSQLDFARAKVKAGAQPWTKAYDTMRASAYGSLSRTPKPRANVECGSGSNPNHGCSDEREDALAAYTDALIWYISRDDRYAKKAIQIMDAWSAVIKEHTNHNAPLQTGWSGASFARAGELIKHTYTGTWAQEKRFATMLRTVYLPTVINGKPNGTNGNWELIMTDAAIGIAVFLDDHTSFDKAVALWRKRLPAYFYLKSDGALPKPPPGGQINTKAEIIKYWQGQTTFVDGLAQETCRDFGHTGWAIDAALHVAETARLQGVDLYGEGRARLTKALEFHATYELGAKAPSWLCKGTVKRGLGPVLEVGYNEYHGRLKVSLPQTAKLVAKDRPAGASYFLAWETLTHAGAP
ncbi:alginate lyase family protein [Actinoallomurus sp. NPDC050550]|uniref:alginate lyase family protein n=1 Tax=Actinoallomurus sp. NPDC050550 TaxID=3154937 RepID=UPI0033C1151F